VLRLKGTQASLADFVQSVVSSAVKGAAEKRRKATMNQRKRRR